MHPLIPRGGGLLLGYLADPDAVVPGGWMSPPAGVGAADREALADYLLGR